jgi:hypothetical protein
MPRVAKKEGMRKHIRDPQCVSSTINNAMMNTYRFNRVVSSRVEFLDIVGRNAMFLKEIQCLIRHGNLNESVVPQRYRWDVNVTK